MRRTGFDSEEKQELATPVSHRNTGKVAGEPIAE
jgi:hypothetical protein